MDTLWDAPEIFPAYERLLDSRHIPAKAICAGPKHESARPRRTTHQPRRNSSNASAAEPISRLAVPAGRPRRGVARSRHPPSQSHATRFAIRFSAALRLPSWLHSSLSLIVTNVLPRGCCHASARKRHRHPNRPGFARSLGRVHHHDLPPRHETPRRSRSQPFGFVVIP